MQSDSETRANEPAHSQPLDQGVRVLRPLVERSQA